MNILSFSCEHCNYKTNKNFNLKRHQSALHKQQSPEITPEQNLEKKEQNIVPDFDNFGQYKNCYIQQLKMEFFCEKCNKKYLTKKHLDNHIKTCNGLDNFTCSICMKHFETYTGKSKHIKKNNCKPRSIIHAINNNSNGSNEKINYINDYGNERTDFIRFDDMIKIFELKGNFIITKYIEFKYFNKDFPENHNMKCEKNNECLIKKDGKWNITDLEYLAKDLILNNSNEILQFYEKEKQKIEEKINNTELVEIMKRQFNYYELNKDRQMYNAVKIQIRNVIKSTKLS